MSDLHFERRGSGPPLVLLHPLGGGIVSWRPVIGLLARERDVIALDMPGFGRSAPLGDGFVPTAANLARAVAEFCQELGVERPGVAGNSLGGWVALEMARQGHASAVVAISPAGLWREPLEPAGLRSQAMRRLRLLASVLLRTARGRELILRTNIAHPGRVPAADARELVMGYLKAPYYAEANARMRAGAFDGADEINVPVTIAWGAEDRIVGRPSRSRWPAHARYLEMEGWGHVPTWDDPEGVAELILEGTSAAMEARPRA